MSICSLGKFLHFTSTSRSFLPTTITVWYWLVQFKSKGGTLSLEKEVVLSPIGFERNLDQSSTFPPSKVRAELKESFEGLCASVTTALELFFDPKPLRLFPRQASAPAKMARRNSRRGDPGFIVKVELGKYSEVENGHEKAERKG